MDLILLLIAIGYLAYRIWDEKRPSKTPYNNGELMMKDLMEGKGHKWVADAAKRGRYK